MRVELKNIGAIISATVEINGITVIAGENSTGKSTVGKALYAFFNTLHDYEQKIKAYRIESIENILDYFFRDRHYTVDTGAIAEKIVANQNQYIEITPRNLIELFSDIDRLELRKAQYYTDSGLDEIAQRIRKSLSVTNSGVLNYIIKKQIDGEFNGQCRNLSTDAPGEIKLCIRKEDIKLSIDNEQNCILNNPIDLNTEVIYLDDPFVMDEGSRITLRALYYYENGFLDHREHLKKKLVSRADQNVVDAIVADESFNTIYQSISKVCNGDIIRSQRNGLQYQDKKLNEPLNIRNLSTGLKTFAILKMLLTNGFLEYNGTIVLDEPEIHLHPEWQLVFAELIILLQKEFHMNILLNTHSPYFLRAIEVYAAKHQIDDNCRYYLSKMDEKGAVIEDVTEEREKIYKILARPLQKLEDMRWIDG